MKGLRHDAHRQTLRLDIGQIAGSVPFRDFQRLLEAFGFVLVRTAGSHRQYAHPKVTRILSIQPRGKHAKSYQIEQFVAMIEEFELSMEE